MLVDLLPYKTPRSPGRTPVWPPSHPHNLQGAGPGHSSGLEELSLMERATAAGPGPILHGLHYIVLVPDSGFTENERGAALVCSEGGGL